MMKALHLYQHEGIRGALLHLKDACIAVAGWQGGLLEALALRGGLFIPRTN